MLILQGDENKKSFRKFDSSLKTVLEFKAQLIAAKSGKQKNFGGFVIRFIKNIQPISVGV